jgi:hypothetical protein
LDGEVDLDRPQIAHDDLGDALGRLDAPLAESRRAAWMRQRPQVGFSRAMRRIRRRISASFEDSSDQYECMQINFEGNPSPWII